MKRVYVVKILYSCVENLSYISNILDPFFLKISIIVIKSKLSDGKSASGKRDPRIRQGAPAALTTV